MTHRPLSLFIALSAALSSAVTLACTGITLRTEAGEHVVARTIEWGGSNLNSQYAIVPRGFSQTAMLAQSPEGGLTFTAKYGYAGLSVEKKEFIVEGLNEQGLSAGLFYFPNYGQYERYDPADRAHTISDLQLVSYVLGQFATVDEAIEGIKNIHIVAIDPRASTVHWRLADKSGKQVVLEIIDGKLRFYDNDIGVLTNAPGFEWHKTNLNNYVNLTSGTVHQSSLGEYNVNAFGAGSAMLGLPGDVTPPSRFVRAAFYANNTPAQKTTRDAVLQSLQILNNFDIPMSAEFPADKHPADLPSATQWTAATDMSGGKLYYRTMYNSTIREIDLNQIDFDHVKYQSYPLDKRTQQPIEAVDVVP